MQADSAASHLPWSTNESQFAPSAQERAIIEAVSDGCVWTREIAARLNVSVYDLRDSMRRLEESGRIKRVGYAADRTTVKWGPSDAA